MGPRFGRRAGGPGRRQNDGQIILFPGSETVVRRRLQRLARRFYRLDLNRTRAFLNAAYSLT